MDSEIHNKTVVMFFLPKLVGGGAERVVTNLIRSVDLARFLPILVLIVMGGNDFRGRIPPDVEIVELGYGNLRRAIPRILALIYQRRPDVIISTLDHLNIAMGLMRPFFPRNCRLILRMTDLDSLSRRAFRYLLGFAAWMADGVIFQSDEMLAEFRGKWKISRPTWAVIPNPIDLSEVRHAALSRVATGFSTDCVELVAAGRLTHNKGFDLLIRAIANLKNPLIRLTILGRGDDELKLKELANDLGIGSLIKFAGFQENPYPFFVSASAFILSSRVEGFPNVVLEALACGTRVVATPVPGVHKLLSGTPGCVIAKAMTPAAIGAAISRVLEDQRLPTPDVVEPYSMHSVTRLYESYFLRVHRQV